MSVKGGGSTIKYRISVFVLRLRTQGTLKRKIKFKKSPLPPITDTIEKVFRFFLTFKTMKTNYIFSPAVVDMAQIPPLVRIRINFKHLNE